MVSMYNYIYSKLVCVCLIGSVPGILLATFMPISGMCVSMDIRVFLWTYVCFYGYTCVSMDIRHTCVSMDAYMYYTPVRMSLGVYMYMACWCGDG